MQGLHLPESSRFIGPQLTVTVGLPPNGAVYSMGLQTQVVESLDGTIMVVLPLRGVRMYDMS